MNNRFIEMAQKNLMNAITDLNIVSRESDDEDVAQYSLYCASLIKEIHDNLEEVIKSNIRK